MSFSNKPFNMFYKPDTGSIVSVQVYHFEIQCDGTAVALCWLVRDKQWIVIDVNKLLPSVTDILNE